MVEKMWVVKSVGGGGRWVVSDGESVSGKMWVSGVMKVSAGERVNGGRRMDGGDWVDGGEKFVAEGG